MEKCIRLTQTVAKGGCAAKVSALSLREILKAVDFPKPHPELLVDASTFDDAAVYKVTDEIALVQTIDFFTPIVDEPFLFGQIAAANALSDVYAMGGLPKTCLGVLAFPLSTLKENVASEVLQGAAEAISRAKANLVGGHSIDDETLKFGLSVTGFVHPQKIWTNKGARIGDSLILTKPLGTGTLCAALKRDGLQPSQLNDAFESMKQLNDVIVDLPAEVITSIHGATDITGFGLSGHSLQMARASNVRLSISMKDVPVFEKTRESLSREFLTKAHSSNRLYTNDSIEMDGLDSLTQLLIHDPQTSGGLLLSVEHSQGPTLLKIIQRRFPMAAIIGTVEPSQDKRLRFS